MSQARRAQDMLQMLGVLDSGFKLVGRAFRTFELVNNHLVEQYTVEDGGFLPQSPTPPVHMLYEGFDNVGKDLTVFEETMGKISDNIWEESAKRWGDERDDEMENEDWIEHNAPRVPDPVPPVTLIERGFSTLHRTFDAFESFMKDQGRFEGEVAVSPAKLAHAQSKNPDTVKAPGKVALDDQEWAGDNSSEKESHSRERVANATDKSLSAQGDQVHTVEKPLKGDIVTRNSTAKEDVPTKGERGIMETSAPARLANTQDSQPMRTPGSSRKHGSGSQDSGQNDIGQNVKLPPTKRKAVFDPEPHLPRAAPVLPYRERASPRTPVRAQGSERPRRESSDCYRPSDSLRVARSDAERDRGLSVASHGQFPAPGRDSTQKHKLPPRPPSMFTELLSPSRPRYAAAFLANGARPARPQELKRQDPRSQESKDVNPCHAQGLDDLWSSYGNSWR